MAPKRWINSTNAIGIISKQGRYNSGTYAHPNIAFEFASWISAEFKLYLVQEFERLKQKDKHPTLDGNMRDYANILQLVILSNLENLNSEMIAQGIEQKIRLERLNVIARKQYNILQDSSSVKRIELLDDDKII